MTDYGHPITFGLSLYPVGRRCSRRRGSSRRRRTSRRPRLPGDPGPRLQPRVPRRLDADHLPGRRDRAHLVRPRRRGPAAAATDDPRQGRRVAQRAEWRPDRPRRRRWRERRRYRRDGRHPAQQDREMVAFTDEALQIMRRALAGGVVEFRGDQHDDRRLRSGAACHRRRSRSGWAARGRGCWPSPDAPATAGSHR